jgi:hypothetical protein
MTLRQKPAGRAIERERDPFTVLSEHSQAMQILIDVLDDAVSACSQEQDGDLVAHMGDCPYAHAPPWRPERSFHHLDSA